MALSPSHFKEKYKNCSVEELESRFNELRKEVEFKTQKEYLKHYMDNLLYPSKNSNLKYESKAIQELLYDKTGNTYEFEKNKFMAIEYYDCYLKAAYGNYMQLPPVEQRVSHHENKAWWK